MDSAAQERAIERNKHAKVSTEQLQGLAQTWMNQENVRNLATLYRWITTHFSQTHDTITNNDNSSNDVGQEHDIAQQQQQKQQQADVEVLRGKVHGVLIDLFTKKVLSPKSGIPASSETLNDFIPFLESIQQQSFADNNSITQATNETLENILTRILKRAPEGSSRPVSFACASLSLNVDTSSFVATGSTFVLRMIRSNNASIRICGLRLSEQLSLRTRSPEAFATLTRSLLDALQGKGGVLSLPIQRVLVLLALQSCGRHLHAEHLQFTTDAKDAVVAEVLPVLLASLEKESEESYRHVHAHTLFEWLHSASSFPDIVIDALKNSLSKTKASAVALLIATVHLARVSLGNAIGNAKLLHLESVVAALLLLLKEALKKPLAVQTDTVLATELLLSLASLSAAVAQQVSANKLWALVTSPSSPLFAPVFQQQLLHGFKGDHGKVRSFNPPHPLCLLNRFFEPTTTVDNNNSNSDGGEEEEQHVLLLLCTRKQSELLAESIPSIARLTSTLQPTCLQQLSCEQTPATTAPTTTGSSLVGLPFSLLQSLHHPSVMVRQHTQAAVTATVVALYTTAATTTTTTPATTFASSLLQVLLSIVAQLSRTADHHLAQTAANFKQLSTATTTTTSEVVHTPSPSTLLGSLLAIAPGLHLQNNNKSDNNKSDSNKSEVGWSIDGQLLGSLLLLLGHPLLGLLPTNNRVAHVIQQLFSPINNNNRAITEMSESQLSSSSSSSLPLLMLSEESASICCDLIDAQLFSPQQSMRQAAQRAIALLAQFFGDSGKNLLLQHFVPKLVSALHSCDATQLSSDDLNKYRDPQTAINNIVAKTEVREDEVKITNADRKKESNRGARRGLFGADQVEDEEWAERVKKEKARKLQLERSGGVSDVNSKAREEVEAVIAKIDALLDEANAALDCLISLCKLYKRVSVSSQPAIASVIMKCFDSVLPHFAFDLLHDKVYSFVLAVAQLIESDLRSFSFELAACVRVASLCNPAVNKLNAGSVSLASFSSLLSLVLRGLASSSRFVNYRRYRQQLTQQELLQSADCAACVSEISVAVIFPVVRAVLANQQTVPGCETAFFVLDSIWPIGDFAPPTNTTEEVVSSKSVLREVLMKSAIETVLLTILRHPRVEPPPQEVLSRLLCQLSDGLSLSEWLPLLGETGFLSSEPPVRVACYRAVLQYTQICAGGVVRSMNPLVESRLWLGGFDVNEECREAGRQLWTAWTERSRLRLSEGYYSALIALFSHRNKQVREAASRAMAAATVAHPATLRSTIESAQTLFLNSQPVVAQAKEIGVPKLVAVEEKKNKPVIGLGIGAIGKPSIPATSGKSKSSEASNNSKPTIALSTPATLTKTLSPQVLAQNLSKEGCREAIALFFAALGSDDSLSRITDKQALVCPLIEFVLRQGACDTAVAVREAMLLAGRSLIDTYGSDANSSAPILEAIRAVLAEKLKSKLPEEVDAFDRRHEAGVVLLGAVGKHLSKDDPTVLQIAEALIQALKTPSEAVQRAVADCLHPVIALIKNNDQAGRYLEQLLSQTLEAESYGDRRGGAYGVSACVKGLGIASLKQHEIVGRLNEACLNGAVNARQGSLFALECLADRLGLLFEPYVITIVPGLLKSFSHSSDYVREAAQGAARVIMSRLSAHGVKQMLTPVLNSLPEETQWKSRQEAIRLLGMMANCAPKQLSACLPQIVPRLVEAGADPHPKVKESAKAAMAEIASVIRSPELSKLAPVLIVALGDPANKTKDALEALLECEFLHSIDAPSLALLAPILSRALRDRSADLKRKGSAITGNIMTMVSDAKSILPYMPALLPGLKGCLVDPIPDVRAASAKAVGALVGGVGEDNDEMKELVPWLFITLVSEASPVERSGAAQGLAEVCLALGVGKLREVLADALPLRSNAKSAPREGLLWLLSFLPSCMASKFGEFIPSTLPVILSGLSDESEGVRDIALKAGQVFVSTLGKDFTAEILPSLRQGMFAEDHRIRLSSVTLLGDLLYMVADTKAVGLAANADDDNDDDDIGMSGGGSARVLTTIRSHLGEATANAILASVYIARSDFVSAVRHIALQVWKSVVTNTPRTLLEIVGELVSQCVDKLSSTSDELRIVAGRALGEIVKKLGDRVLPFVMPHLQRGLTSSSAATRQGVCLGLSEILNSSSRKQIEDYLPLLVSALQQALSDDSEEVRAQAAKAFQTLFKSVGMRAVEQVVPPLLASLVTTNNGDEDGDADMDAVSADAHTSAFVALRELVQARPRDLLEYLLPRLVTSPMQTSSAQVLGAIADVCSVQLMYHFNFLVPTYIDELQAAEELVAELEAEQEGNEEEGDDNDNKEEQEGEESKEEEDEEEDVDDEEAFEDIEEDEDEGSLDLEREQERLEAIKESAASVFGAVATQGVGFLLSELGLSIEHDTDTVQRRWGCWLLEQFLARTKADFTEYIPLMLRYLLTRIADTDESVLSAMISALTVLVNTVPLDKVTGHLDFMRNCINSAASDARHRPGYQQKTTATGGFLLDVFALPKALDPFVALYLHGLLNGNVSVREQSADGLTDVISATDATALKPYLVKITGPLIRVLGDRFPSEVKAAILRALSEVLAKGGVALKAFAPQLQTTFVKSLSDPSKLVRQRAVHALGQVMSLSARVDPLLGELCALCSSSSNNNNSEDNNPGNAIKASVLAGLASALRQCGDKATAASLDRVRTLVLLLVTEEDAGVRSMAAKCLGGVAAFAEPRQVTDLLIDILAINSGNNNGTEEAAVAAAAGRVLALAAVVQSSGNASAEMRDELIEALKKAFIDDRAPVRMAACMASLVLFTPPDYVGGEARRQEHKAGAVLSLHSLADSLATAAADAQSGETRKLAIQAIKEAAKRYPQASARHLQRFIPALMTALKDVQIRIKYASERCLFHLLDGGSTTAVAAFEAGAAAAGNQELVRSVRDYCRSTISRLAAADSDNEGDKW